METITILKREYEELLSELERLRKEKEEIDFNVERQIREGLEDLKKGKIMIKKPLNDLALLSEESFSETWLNEKENEAWKDL